MFLDLIADSHIGVSFAPALTHSRHHDREAARIIVIAILPANFLIVLNSIGLVDDDLAAELAGIFIVPTSSPTILSWHVLVVISLFAST